MIAILGVTSDDILYFRTKMSLKETVHVFGTIEAYVGTFSKEAAVVCAVGESDYLSALVTASIITQFKPYLVFNVGTVSSFSPSLKQGDLFIPERYYFAQVDFTLAAKGQFGQIPGQGAFFVADTQLNGEVENTAYLLTNRYVQRGNIMSGETFVMNERLLTNIVAQHYLLDGGIVAYDTNSAGVALACQLSQTAVLTLKAVNYQVGKEDQRLNYVRKGLEAMPTIGKIITKFLIEKESE